MPMNTSTMTAVVTGSSGLVGSEAVRQLVERGYLVIGLDNDMRRHFFGDAASTASVADRLIRTYKHDEFRSYGTDIRDIERIEELFGIHHPKIVIHTAAQPAHDWAVKDPRTDFGINAVGTLNLLEAWRRHSPEDAPFIHCSTSKVYGANPNDLPLEELDTRLDLPRDHRFWGGITPEMSIDRTTHSLFGASKAAGDLVVQEYGRYFDRPTVCFRPGCLTGPAHEGAELHGFLSYLMRCTMTGKPYTVFGYDAKQVRCNLHSEDLVRAFLKFADDPTAGAVYNIGGGRVSNCSMIEAIMLAERMANRPLHWTYNDTPRIGDHRWWISSNREFRERYDWHVMHNTEDILREIFEANRERWT